MKLHALLLATLAATGVAAAQSPKIVVSRTGLTFTQAPGSGKSAYAITAP